MSTPTMIVESRKEVIGAKEFRFPFLGTAGYFGPLAEEAEKHEVRPLNQFNPVCADAHFQSILNTDELDPDILKKIEEVRAPDSWFCPEDGIETCRVLEEVLSGKDCPGALEAIRHYLVQELKCLAGILVEADAQNTMFRVRLEESVEAPSELVRWIRETYSDVAEALVKVLKKHEAKGILQKFGFEDEV